MSFRAIRLMTAGESHGPMLVGILEGLPAGVPVALDEVNADLVRRMGGYGRGKRMKIERDRVRVVGGVRHGHTLGSPVAWLIENRDWTNWEDVMSPDPPDDEDATGGEAAGASGGSVDESGECGSRGGSRDSGGATAETGDRPSRVDRRRVTRPRPGHADLAGGLKYDRTDLRDVLERASARETATRVAAGGFCKQLLSRLDIRIASHVLRIGPAAVAGDEPIAFGRIEEAAEDSPVRCADPAVSEAMVEAIDAAGNDLDTLGGTFEVVARGVPPGLGSHIQWDRKIDGRLSQAMVSIPAMKAVEIGDGVWAAGRPGSEVHDPIVYDEEGGRFERPTNRAGGTEGGVTNGAELRVKVHMKPLSTLRKPLPSVDIVTGEAVDAVVQRSDVCAVPAAAVVGEAMMALVLADTCMEKFGGDSLEETRRNWRGFLEQTGRFPLEG